MLVPLRVCMCYLHELVFSMRASPKMCIGLLVRYLGFKFSLPKSINGLAVYYIKTLSSNHMLLGIAISFLDL